MVDASQGSLRERQKHVARVAIVEAAAEEIAEKGLAAVSLQAVAARAGVSTRTLYNYFENRDALHVAIGELSAERAAASTSLVMDAALDSLDGLGETIARVWLAWEAQGSLYEAVRQIDAAGVTGQEVDVFATDRGARSGALQRSVADARPDLRADEVEEVAALLHAFAGPAVWHRMKVTHGLDAERSGRVATWAIGLILDALRRGDSPGAGVSGPS